MIIDPVEQVGLVTREVRSGSRDGVPTKIAVARRSYATDQGDLWDALTNTERIPRWFLPVSGDLEPGGRYQVEGNASGVIERCQAPDSFAATWEFGGMISWLEVRLQPAGDGTMLELVHEAPLDPDRWREFGPGAVGVGWDLALWGLDLHIQSGVPVDPELAATFHTTPEGIEFIRGLAASWADAAVADGDAPGQAQAAAGRTAAFYTGQPQETSQAE